MPVEHLLDHVYALATSRLGEEEREAFDGWLWSDPEREAKLRAILGR